MKIYLSDVIIIAAVIILSLFLWFLLAQVHNADLQEKQDLQRLQDTVDNQTITLLYQQELIEELRKKIQELNNSLTFAEYDARISEQNYQYCMRELEIQWDLPNTCVLHDAYNNYYEVPAVHGLSWPENEFYCVWTNKLSDHYIQQTDYEEMCHVMVHQNYGHFCKGEDWIHYSTQFN